MTIPNLAGVIKKDDIYQKGGGSFKASYVAWAKTSQLLREHAPGWFFYLAAKNEEYVWSTPDGSGYLMCFFENGEQRTPLFPFPIMDNRNMPVKLEKISSRIFTDSHRRALCACAAFTFGLAYELWADEEVLEAGAQPENPKQKASNTPPPNDGSLKKTFASAIKAANDLKSLENYRTKFTTRHEQGALTDTERDELLEAYMEKEESLAAR
mgnify:CR=1 FL=1